MLYQAGGWYLIRRAVPSPPWYVPCQHEGHNPWLEDRSSRAGPAAVVGQGFSVALSPYMAAAAAKRPPVLSPWEPRSGHCPASQLQSHLRSGEDAWNIPHQLPLPSLLPFTVSLTSS